MDHCKENGDECKTCTGKNCNRLNSFRRCLYCSTTEDRQCAINPQLSYSKICRAYYDKCFTFIGRFGVSRGCVDERDAGFEKKCNNDHDKCKICSELVENGCNNGAIVMETCVACSSKKDAECLTDPSKYKDKVCSGISTVNRTGCYLRIVSSQK